jgi:chromatin remodeling complex protein RSC6
MVRVSSKVDKQSASVVAPTPVIENVVEKVAKPRVSKKAAVVDVVPVTASTAPETVVVEGLDAESSAAARITEFSAKLQQIGSLFASMKADFKNIEKAVARELKIAQKSSSKRRKVSTGNRAPSGFVKPTRISDELAKFLGKSAGVEMARTSVSKEINAYIREKGLQDPANGRKINPDASLTKLLNLQTTDELTYFNLQRYMKHHFIKEVPVVVDPPTATA